MLYTPNEATFGAYARNRGAYSFVPKNDTIYNIVMRVISQKVLEQKRKSFLISAKIFVVYLLGLLLAIVIFSLLYL
jgi:hypothetical protein